MNKSVIVSTSLLFGLISGFSLTSTNSTQASSWHKGTPKSVRGAWARGTRNGVAMLTIDINSKGLYFDYVDIPEMAMRHPKYKFVKHNYYLIYGRMTNPTYKPFYGKYAIYRHGHTATIKGSNLNGALHFKLLK
ncbi:hypothetical protein [Lentilactobacillus sp. Marseille-Q4993]|uniref:hypothetical protein n=1 Tax=Lentilactobacillus sp. Marseille-Q4993 TaxID=3039492 RepID=UPI0024BC16CD|nr:hypothetical protein [Lentilactobacillus sp. Marseille-Q4993]